MLNLQPSEIIIVGDIDADMKAGKNGEVLLTVQFLSESSQELSPNADVTITELTNLKEILR